MSESFKKTKIWTKLILLGLVILYVLIFVIENYSRSVNVWLWNVHTMSVLELLVIMFLIGVVATLLARPTYRTICQISELRKKPPEKLPEPVSIPEPSPIEPAKPTP